MDNFVRKYALSKTLRFELKPVGETAEKIEDFKKAIVEQDKERAEKYKKLKKVIDEYHRDFIEDTFKNADIKSDEFQEAYELYKQCKKQGATDKDKDTFKEKQKTIRKNIAELFKENNKKWFAYGNGINSKRFKDYKINKEDKTRRRAILLEWLDKSESIKYLKKTEEITKEDAANLVSYFSDFSRYLSQYDINRENMYTAKDRATAIPYRIVNDNMVKHFDNCIRFTKIEKNFSDFYSKLEQFKNDFTPSAFGQFLNQSGIDKYNYEIIGRPADDENAKRVNMLINEHIQTKGLKGKDRPPKFTHLFKQILSDRESKIIIDEYVEEPDMLCDIKNQVEQILYVPDDKRKTIFDRIDDFLTEYMIDELADGIYIRKGVLGNLSSKIWGGENWHIIRDAINTYAENNFKTKRDKETYTKKEAYSISMLQNAIDQYVPTLDKDKIKQNVKLMPIFQEAEYYTEDMEPEDKGKTYRQVIDERYQQAKNVLELKTLGNGKEREKNLYIIKQLLDAILDFEHFLKDIDLNQKQKDKIEDLNADFYDTLAALHNEIRKFIPLYNKTRNFVTKKPYSTKKFTLNFDHPDLLNGFVDSHTDNSDNGTQYGAYLFRKKREDGNFWYYLGVTKDAKLFRHHLAENVKENDKSEYERIYYYQMKPASFYGNSYDGDYKQDKNELIETIIGQVENIAKNKKVDDLIKAYTEQKNLNNNTDDDNKVTPTQLLKTIETEMPELYQRILKSNTFIQKQQDIIKKFKDALRKYKTKISGIQHHIDGLPNDIKGALNRIEEISKIRSTVVLPVSQKEWKEVAARDKNAKPLYLFKILNKDLAVKSSNHGKDNLHTMYFKGLFEEGQTSIDLGKGEIFFRDKSIPEGDKFQHNKGEVLKHKRHSDVWDELELKNKIRGRLTKEQINSFLPELEIINTKHGEEILYQGKVIGKIASHPKVIGKIASHPIVKDKRFTEDKFQLHLSIELNYKEPKISAAVFNKYVNKQHLYKDRNGERNVKIIGIDRGERNLLYYTIIDQKRNILTDEQDNRLQGSFNIVENIYQSYGRDISIKTDYRDLLDKKEKQRDIARKSWSTIENIKELKSGYLSHIVHRIATLMIKYNAIVALEDLNFGFKRERFKVEKQVYQKFEKALIDKLNYLVFKDRKAGEDGHYLNGYQLTALFESFEKLGNQSGFLFYVPAWKTSDIDPVTGFVNLFYIKNDTQKYLKEEFFSKFKSIKYNPNKNYFEFEFDYKDFHDKAGDRTVWAICSHGDKRSFHTKKEGWQTCNVTDNLAKLFKEKKISFDDGYCIKKQILAVNSASFFQSLAFNFARIVQLRHTFIENGQEIDCIISPVIDEKTGEFFDSREYENMKNPPLPKDADANGAYHIALKGLMTLDRIQEDGTILKHKKGETNKDWLNFAQKDKD